MRKDCRSAQPVIGGILQYIVGVWALQQCGGVRALIWLSNAALLREGNTRQLALLRVLRGEGHPLQLPQNHAAVVGVLWCPQ